MVSNTEDIIKIKYSRSSDFTTLLNTALHLPVKSAKSVFMLEYWNITWPQGFNVSLL